MVKTEPGNFHVSLLRPLKDDGLAVSADGIDYLLDRIEPDEMADIRRDVRKQKLRGTPTMFCFDGDVVRVFPTPDREYEVIIVNFRQHPDAEIERYYTW